MGLSGKHVHRICDVICDRIVESAFEARRQTSEVNAGGASASCSVAAADGVTEFRVGAALHVLIAET